MKYPLNVLLVAVVILFSSFTLINEKTAIVTMDSEHALYNHTIISSIKLQPSLTISKPAGGQDYCLDQAQYIEWATSGGSITKVSIYLMHANGQTIISTIASNIANSGQYLWNGAASSSGNYLIKITGMSSLTPDLITGQTTVFTLNDCRKPDLQVGHVEVVPQNPGEGQRVTFKGNVMNYGENPVENPTVTLKVERPGGLSDLTVTEEIETTLAENQGITFEKRFRVPVAGSYKTTFTLDPGDAVDEMNELNNEKNWTFGVHPLPDLVVYMSNGKRPPVGRSREIRMVVKNIGNYPTNAQAGIKLRSYVKAKGVETYDIPALAPNATHTIKRNHSWGLAGTKKMTAKIIYTKDEIKSNNNEVECSFFVRLPHHDTYSASYAIKGSTGETFTNWDEIEN